MSQHENRHLEFVVADVRVGVPHLERLSPHEDCTSLLDSVLHLSGVSERRQVAIKATCVAILIGYKPVKRDGHSDDTFCQWGLRVRLCRSVISRLAPEWTNSTSPSEKALILKRCVSMGANSADDAHRGLPLVKVAQCASRRAVKRTSEWSPWKGDRINPILAENRDLPR